MPKTESPQRAVGRCRSLCSVRGVELLTSNRFLIKGAELACLYGVEMSVEVNSQYLLY